MAKDLPPLTDLLVTVSSQIMELTPPSARLGVPDRKGLPAAIAEVLDDDPSLGTIVVLAAELLGDELLRSLVVERLAAESAMIEPMLAELRGAVVSDAFEVREPFDESRHLSVGIRFPGGEELSALVMVHHAGGLHLGDAFVVDQPIDTLRQVTEAEADLTIVDGTQVEVRRILDDAIRMAYRTLPRPVTDTWPDCAALVEWVVRKLPAAPPASVGDPMSDEAEAAFVESFLASEERRSLRAGDKTLAEAVAMLAWFKDGYTNGDVHRWGPGQVERFLTDWGPRKIDGGDRELRRYPKILRALIPWSHRQIGLEARHTAMTLEAVDRFEPKLTPPTTSDLQNAEDAVIEARRLLEAFGNVDDDGDPVFDLDLDEDLDVYRAKRQARRRAEAVGGADRLAALTTEPLPAGEIPPVDHLDTEIRDTVAGVAGEAARVASELYGPEYGTAAARLTVRVAEADPKALSRGKPQSAVAGLVWMTASANANRYSVSMAEIRQAAGTSADPRGRARTFTRTLGCEYDDYEELLYGTPDVLVSSRRQQLIDEEATAS